VGQPGPTTQKRLTLEQFEALSRCAKGISLRYDNPRLVQAVINAGYVQQPISGIVTVTAEGRQYLRAHASELDSQ